MNLLSIGDQIGCGTYSLHSRFARAANFVDGTRMVFVVAEEIGAGPLNVVLPDLDAVRAGSLVIGKTEMVLAGQVVAYRSANRYRSELPVERCSGESLTAGLEVLRHTLVEAAPAKSLAFLIDASRLANFQGSFEREFVRQISRGAAAISTGELRNGAAALKGCGTGLTPSGDDFVAGLLLGMNLRQQLLREDWQDAIESVFATAHGDNLLSNTFLEMARRGCVSERMKCLIAAMIVGDEARLQAAAQALFAIGATSGADMATGFYMMMRERRGVVIQSANGAGFCQDQSAAGSWRTAEACAR